MAEFKTFSFKNVNSIFGIIEIQGYAEVDDAVSIVTDTDQFTDTAGAKGDVTRVQTSDNRVTIVHKLLQTSSTNKLLNTAFLVDRETGANVLPMIIEDKESGETFIINNSWITKIPDITRGRGLNQMIWTFRGDFMTPVIA